MQCNYNHSRALSKTLAALINTHFYHSKHESYVVLFIVRLNKGFFAWTLQSSFLLVRWIHFWSVSFSSWPFFHGNHILRNSSLAMQNTWPLQKTCSAYQFLADVSDAFAANMTEPCTHLSAKKRKRLCSLYDLYICTRCLMKLDPGLRYLIPLPWLQWTLYTNNNPQTG